MMFLLCLGFYSYYRGFLVINGLLFLTLFEITCNFSCILFIISILGQWTYSECMREEFFGAAGGKLDFTLGTLFELEKNLTFACRVEES